jgi:cyclase
VVLSIDAQREGSGYAVRARCGSTATGLSPEIWARRGVELGAGEILLTSIDRDGSLEGYDLELCRRVADNVDVPVLISGGAGSWKHFVEGIERGGASAVCTSNIFHFTEASLKSAKAFMAKAGIMVRL